VLEALPDFHERMRWFVRNRPDLCGNVFEITRPGEGERLMLSLLDPDRLRLVRERMLDEAEFLSPHGIRSLSRCHADHPVTIQLDGAAHSIDYEPGESTPPRAGGHPYRRGPRW